MNLSVLIMAQEPMVGHIIADKLRREGYEIHTDPAAAQSEDIVICDASFAGDSNVTSRARLGWLAILDARTAPERQMDVMRSGAAGIIFSPFKPTVVAAQVAALSGVKR